MLSQYVLQRGHKSVIIRGTYYPGVCTKPGTYLLSGLVYVHEVLYHLSTKITITWSHCIYTVRSETFAVLNFRGFRGTARHPRKLNPRKSYTTLYVQRYAQESFQRTKKQECRTFRILYRLVFSSVMSIKSFFTPIRRSISD